MSELMQCRICGKEHPRGIGATLMPRILGLVPKTNALDVYHRLTRPQPDPDDTETEESIDTLRGHRLERDAATDYWRLTGRKGRKVGGVTSHPDFPAFQVHLDYQVFSDDSRDPDMVGPGNLELKAPRASRFDRILNHGLFQSELVQTWTQSAVSRWTWGSLAFYNLEHNRGPLFWIDQVLDPKMGTFLLEAGQRFWDEHVVKRVPPDPTEWELFAKADAPKLIELAGEVVLVEDEGVVRLAEEFIEARDLREQAAGLYEKAAAAMLEAQKRLGVKRVQVPSIAGKFTVVQNAGRVSFQKDALALARPIDWDLARDFLLNMGVPEDEINEVLEGMALDLGRFERQGEPSEYVLPPRRRD